jgi:protein ImuB
MSRWLALWLPRLPSDRLIRSGQVSPGDKPLIVYAKTGNAYTITSLDRRASALGLRVGMPVADARAVQPHLVAVEADEEADGMLLDRIASWCDRYSPIVVKDPPHGLFIDLTGCSHLFGGDGAVLSDLEKRLTKQGFISRSAIAPTPGAAWAMARAGRARLADEDTLGDILSPLPVTALRLEDSAITLMKRLGLETIGQIMNGPRKPFTARAGRHAMMRLDQAFGRTREALTPHRPPPEQFALRRLVEPITSMEAVMTVAESLTEELCSRLRQDGKGALIFRLHLFGVDNRTRAVELGLSRAESDPGIVLRLLGERIGLTPQALDAEFGFDAIRLDAHEILPVILRPIDLAPVSIRDREAEARLVDRLAIRLGDQSIGRPSVRLVHAPERTNRWTKLPVAANAPPLAEDGVVRRPLTLFRRAQPVTAISPMPDGPPKRFTWRRIAHDVIRAEGPERIAPNWLRAPDDRTRDYYRVEDKDGRRFWLYSEGPRDGMTPQWYLHGIFP